MSKQRRNLHFFTKNSWKAIQSGETNPCFCDMAWGTLNFACWWTYITSARPCTTQPTGYHEGALRGHHWVWTWALNCMWLLQASENFCIDGVSASAVFSVGKKSTAGLPGWCFGRPTHNDGWEWQVILFVWNLLLSEVVAFACTEHTDGTMKRFL